MSATLDRKRPFGEVIGSGEAHRYEQDGKLFDVDGKELASGQSTGEQSQVDAELVALKAEASELGLKFHPNTGLVKMRELVAAGSAPATGEQSQVDAQLKA